MCEIYKKARDALRSAKVKMRKSALKESREQFLNTIDTKEINDQLDDSLYDADRGAGCQKRWCTIRKNEDTLPNFYLTSLRGTHRGSQTGPPHPYDQSYGRILPGTRNVKSEMINLQS